MKRMNFSENRAKGASSFQCYLEKSFDIKHIICIKGSESHIVEFSEIKKGSVEFLLLANNSYTKSGIFFDSSISPPLVTFTNCVFTKNKGNNQFIKIVNSVNLQFIGCLYEGDAGLGVGSSEIEITSSCIIPSYEVGFSTYECHGALLKKRGDCTNNLQNSQSFILGTFSILETIKF